MGETSAPEATQEFVLHERLQADCIPCGRLRLCDLLLMNDTRYPWFLLVPQRVGIAEIHELEPADQQLLLTESVALSRAISAAFRPDKLNVAAIGNIVRQLHVHHVARYRDDPVWPGVVWGTAPGPRYVAEAAEALVGRLLAAWPDACPLPDRRR